MDNMNNSNMTTENAADFSELIRSIKKISAIVVVDDVRKLTSEDMKKIPLIAREDIEKSLGESVVTNKNALNYKYVDDEKLIEDKKHNR